MLCWVRGEPYGKTNKTIPTHYPSDLTDHQWLVLEPLLKLDPDEPARTYDVRDIVDAVFYLNRASYAWLYLPENLPPWQKVQYYFYEWTADGTWEHTNTELRKLVRVTAGKAPDSTAGSVDAQSVKATENLKIKQTSGKIGKGSA